jgi:hypothetical protein
MDHREHEVETMAESFYFCPDKGIFFIEKRRVPASIYIIVKCNDNKSNQKYEHNRSNKRNEKVLFPEKGLFVGTDSADKMGDKYYKFNSADEYEKGIKIVFNLRSFKQRGDADSIIGVAAFHEIIPVTKIFYQNETFFLYQESLFVDNFLQLIHYPV